jgi:putative salt-induced outer membrane protein YdiY
MYWSVLIFLVLFNPFAMASDLFDDNEKPSDSFEEFTIASDPFENFAIYGETPKDDRYEQNKNKLLFGDLGLGFLVTTGNTNTASIKFNTHLMQEINSWRNQLNLDVLTRKELTSDSELESTSASRYFTSLQSNYLLQDQFSSLFVYGDFESDKFNGIDKQLSLVTGYGWRFYETGKDSIDLDIGPGINYQTTAEGSSQLGYVFRLALDGVLHINERSRFNQVMSIEHSLSSLNSRFKSETSIVSQINGRLGLRLSYLYRYNTKPEVNKRDYDSETSATFVFSF